MAPADAVAAAARDAARDLAARPPASSDEGRAALRRALARALADRAGRRFTVIPEDNARLRAARAGLVRVDVGVRGRLGGRHRALVACGWLDGEAGIAAARDAAWGVAVAAEEARADAWLVTAGPAGADPPLGRLDGGAVARAPLDPGVAGWEVAARRVSAG